jgi:3-isopropylmalate dehydrogenase
LLPGDGIGPEVMAEVKRVIDLFNKIGPERFNTEEALVGGCCYDAHGVAVTDATVEKAKAADAIIFGAVGGPKWDKVPYDVRPEAGLLRLRKDLALFANIRPAIVYPALADSSSLKREVVEGLDVIILRELTGGVYFGEPKTITDLGNGQKRAIDTQVYDTYEIERIGRVACELARKRRNKVTSMEKRNVMKTGVLWNEVDDADARARVQGRSTRAHAGRCRRHAAGALAQAVRRHRHRQSFRRRAVRYCRTLTGSLGMLPSASWAKSIPRRASARRSMNRCTDRARHRRKGHRQSDRHDRLVRDGPAIFLQSRKTGRLDRSGDFRGAGQRFAHGRYQIREYRSRFDIRMGTAILSELEKLAVLKNGKRAERKNAATRPRFIS